MAIRIRMYRIGLGDCFLVSFGSAASQRQHILFDCGVFGTGNTGTLDDAMDNIFTETGGKLAALVVTHAHLDHVSGFGNKYKDFWAQFKIGNLFMPWTEDPDDDDAKELRKKKTAFATRLAATRGFGAGPLGAAAKTALELAATKDGMANLLDGIIGQAQPRFLAPFKKLTDAAGIDSLDIDVLGPPKDRDLLEDMDPPDDESYKLVRTEFISASQSHRAGPFPLPPSRSVKTKPLRFPASYEKELETAAEFDPNLLALAYDKFINNTSLVLLLRYKGKLLLFPGDAQFGNWSSWMNRAGMPEILGKLDFLKVGHHASHNASPASMVKLLPKKAVAMVSTEKDVYNGIPLGDLLTALRSRCRAVVCSNQLSIKKGAARTMATPIPDAFTKGDFWLDYSL